MKTQRNNLKLANITLKITLTLLIDTTEVSSAEQICDLPEALCKADQELEIADTELNKVYREIISLMDSDHYKDYLVDKKSIISSLRESQRAWIKFRDAHCDAYYELHKGGTSRNIDLENCLIVTTNERAEELKSIYLHGNEIIAKHRKLK